MITQALLSNPCKMLGDLGLKLSKALTSFQGTLSLYKMTSIFNPTPILIKQLKTPNQIS